MEQKEYWRSRLHIRGDCVCRDSTTRSQIRINELQTAGAARMSSRNLDHTDLNHWKIPAKGLGAWVNGGEHVVMADLRELNPR